MTLTKRETIVNFMTTVNTDVEHNIGFTVNYVAHQKHTASVFMRKHNRTHNVTGSDIDDLMSQMESRFKTGMFCPKTTNYINFHIPRSDEMVDMATKINKFNRTCDKRDRLNLVDKPQDFPYECRFRLNSTESRSISDCIQGIMNTIGEDATTEHYRMSSKMTTLIRKQKKNKPIKTVRQMEFSIFFKDKSDVDLLVLTLMGNIEISAVVKHVTEI